MSYFDILDYIDKEKFNSNSEHVSSINIQQKLILNETTGSDSVAFIPAHLGTVKAKVADLAKKKRDWKIEILEQDNDREVSFEDALKIVVPNDHWDSFCSIFDSAPSNNNYINLNSLLNETMEEEMQDLRKELRVALAHLYDESEFRKLNKNSGIWKWVFGAISYNTKGKGISTPVTQENKGKDIQKLYDKLLEVYGSDRGNLEMIIEAIKDKKPLNTFGVFKGYDFLYGTRIYSKYHRVNLYFESLVDMSYHISETIYVPKNSDLLDKIVEESREVKVVRNIIYPKGGVFTSRFLQVLSDTIEDLETEEGEE